MHDDLAGRDSTVAYTPPFVHEQPRERPTWGFAEGDELAPGRTVLRRIGGGRRYEALLVWDEHLGWYIAVETAPAEAPVVVAYLDGDVVPPPAAVARFVADAADGRRMSRFRPVLPPIERGVLAEKMAELC